MKKLLKIIRFKDICNLKYVSKSEKKKQNFLSFFASCRYLSGMHLIKK